MSRKRVDAIKKKSIGDDEFFAKISEKCNYTDIQLVKDVYYSMIRTVTQELRERNVVNMPDFMLIRSDVGKARRMMDVNTRRQYILPAQYKLTSLFDYKLKKYFSSLKVE